jgi:hypothetical protein
MHVPLARSDYYEASAPSAAVSRQRTCPPSGWKPDAGRPRMVPTFTRDRSMREAPAFTPTASPRLRRRLSPWPPHRADATGFGVGRPAETRQPRAAHRPISVRFEPALDLRSVRQRFLTYAFSSLLAGPGLSDSANPSRTLSEAAPAFPGVPRIRLPPSFTGQLRLTSRVGLSPPLNLKRLVAHHRLPIVRRRLHHHPLNAQLDQMIRQLGQRPRHGRMSRHFLVIRQGDGTTV